MDKLQIRIAPPNPLQGDLVIKVLINGNVVTDEDYCLNVDSFFSAIGEQESTVRLVGGCGIPECCEEGYRTWSHSTCWSWGWPDSKPFSFNWSEIFGVATEILTEVERLPQNARVWPELRSRMPFYKEKIRHLRELADTSN